MLVADGGIGEILERIVGPVHHHLGDGAQHAGRNVLRRRMVLGQRHVEHALGFRIHVAGEIEAREIEPRRQALAFRRGGGGGDQTAIAAR